MSCLHSGPSTASRYDMARRSAGSLGWFGLSGPTAKWIEKEESIVGSGTICVTFPGFAPSGVSRGPLRSIGDNLPF